MQVNMREATSQLSRLGRLARAGEEVVIAKAEEPYLRPEPHAKLPIDRKPGTMKGEIWVALDFDDTDQGVIDSFYDSQVFPNQDE